MNMQVSVRTLLMMITAVGLSACGMAKSHGGYGFQSYKALKNIQNIEPAVGDMHAINLGAAPKKSCSFSSFHRKNAIGYEIDDRRHIGFNVSPSVDLFDPSDAEVKVGLNFTMAFGGPANKRPKCTYGTGYYGYLPFAINDGVNLSGLTDINTIKSFVQEKLEEREQRRVEREANLRI